VSEALPPLAATAAFFDFDGTLVDIADRPEAVVVDPAIPDLLTRLRAACGGALAIVTGRPVAAVDGFLPDLDLDSCGLHGLERRVGGRVLDAPPLPSVSREAETLREKLSRHPGVVIENKGISVAVHWRMAPEAEGEARKLVNDLLRRLGPEYRLQQGKAVCEVVPARAGKGEAIRALMAEPPYRGRVPVFFGDDVTDEHGFGMVNALGGVGVKIGPGDTAAAWRIESPSALRALLNRWLSGSPDGDEWLSLIRNQR
jgi:trehalose 6-phosphate phosphatase